MLGPNELSVLGADFAGMSYVDKVRRIDEAVDRVLLSQESETSSNRNKRADLDKIMMARQVYYRLSIYQQQPSQFMVGRLERR